MKKKKRNKVQKQNHELTKQISKLMLRFPSFDIVKVFEFLKQLNETDPDIASKYNHPLGWEYLWTNDFKIHDKLNTKSLMDKVKSGEESILERYALIQKYLKY